MPKPYRPRDPERRASMEATVAKYGEPISRPMSSERYYGGTLANRNTAAGVVYRCLWCRYTTLGSRAADRHHFTDCPAYPKAETQADARDIPATSNI